jgi:hypothetical protein
MKGDDGGVRNYILVMKEKKEGSTAANSGLLRGTVGGDNGVKDIDAKICIPSCVNMKDMDGVISLVHPKLGFKKR